MKDVETNKFPAECLVCKAPLAAGAAVYGVKIGEWSWLCRACREAAPGHEPMKIMEAFLAQFADEAGGPDDDRDHEDFRIGEYLVESGRISSYSGPFGQEVTKSAAK